MTFPPSIALDRHTGKVYVARAERSQTYQANCACNRPMFSQAPSVP